VGIERMVGPGLAAEHHDVAPEVVDGRDRADRERVGPADAEPAGRIAVARHAERAHVRYLSRSTVFSTLPLAFRGSASTKANEVGFLYEARCFWQWATSSSVAGGCAGSRGTITARGVSTHFGCGTPITATSATSGCDERAASTSAE